MHVLERKEDKTCDRYSSSAADYKHRSFKGNWRSSFQYCVAAFCVRLDNCNHLGYSLNATDGKEREVHFTEELDKKSSSNVCVTAMKCLQTWYDDLILCWSRHAAVVAGVPPGPVYGPVYGPPGRQITYIYIYHICLNIITVTSFIVKLLKSIVHPSKLTKYTRFRFNWM